MFEGLKDGKEKIRHFLDQEQERREGRDEHEDDPRSGDEAPTEAAAPGRGRLLAPPRQHHAAAAFDDGSGAREADPRAAAGHGRRGGEIEPPPEHRDGGKPDAGRRSA